MNKNYKIYSRSNTDCLTACYATILKLPYETVPQFYDEETGIVIDNWTGVRNAFLALSGYYSLKFERDFLSVTKGKVIIEIKTKQHHHAVIAKDGKLWHDPSNLFNKIPYKHISSVEILIPIL